MFCGSCGNVCPDGSTKCPSCGAALPATTSAPSTNPYASSSQGAKPNNNLIFAIFTTLCCCIPFGIVAIVYAAQVDGKWNSGDYNGSIEAANNAKKWCWIALALGLIGNILAVVVQFGLLASQH